MNPRLPQFGPLAPDPSTLPHDPVSQLAASARGWHRIQLAVLGFVGICGVLWAGGDPSGPAGLQWVAGTLAVGAFVLALLATYLVGRVAHPFYGVVATHLPASAGGPGMLRAGIRLTYLAVALLVAASLSAWWPGPAGAGAVEVRDATGRTWCGELVDAPAGAVRLDTADGPVTVPADRIAQLRPVTGC